MRLFRLLAALVALAAVPVQAGERLIVAELFTSQGCNSCPPADALLTRLAERHPELLALSFAVDYWDYLGWKDSFGKAAHSDRQRAYGRALGRRNIYTPQLVLNGRHEAVGSRGRSVLAALEAAKADRPADVDIRFIGNGTVAVSGADAARKRVLAVWYRPQASVEVKRGENRGRTLHYTNIVLGLQWLTLKNRAGDVLDLPLDAVRAAGTDRLAILVQDGEAGPIAAAAAVQLTEGLTAAR